MAEEDNMSVDPPSEIDEQAIMRQKVINEEYKVWKKHAVFLYDVMLSRALDWPTLTTQWFPDVVEPPGEDRSIHRLLIGTHTNGDARNYLEIAELSVPHLKPDPADYNEETGEIGGYGGGKKKPQQEMTFKIKQKIDHPTEVNKARYMPQNPNLIATMCGDGKTLIFDRTMHESEPKGVVKPQIELVGHTEEGFGLHFNPTKEGELVTGSADSTVKIWNLPENYKSSSKTLKPTRTFSHHTASVNGVEFHHKFEWMVATVSDDRTLQILDLREPGNNKVARCVQDAHSDDINCVAFNLGTDVLLATGSADKTVGIWDLRNLESKLHACEAHRDSITNLDWSPHSKSILASSSIDRRLNIWDLSRCGEEQTPEDAEDGPPELLFIHGGHTDRIADFSWNKNEEWLMASAAEDNLLQVWRPANGIVGREEKDIALEELES